MTASEGIEVLVPCPAGHEPSGFWLRPRKASALSTATCTRGGTGSSSAAVPKEKLTVDSVADKTRTAHDLAEARVEASEGFHFIFDFRPPAFATGGCSSF